MLKLNINEYHYSNNENNRTEENETIEMLINIHYELSDLKHRLEGKNLSFLQKMLDLSEMEIQMRMERIYKSHG